jgi:hypothetical protein
MIQFILMLLGLASSNNDSNIMIPNNSPLLNVQSSASQPSGPTEDTSGETEQTPPPRKK